MPFHRILLCAARPPDGRIWVVSVRSTIVAEIVGAEPTGVLLIGTGFMGKMHSHAWHTVSHFFDTPPPRLVGVVASDRDRTEAFAERWTWPRWETDLSRALAWDGIDLVDVTSPNNLHRAHSEAAFEAGAHVICEKPLSHQLADSVAMVDAAERSGRRTYVWYNYRRVPAVTLARQLVQEGRIGQLLQVRAAYLQSWGLSSQHAWRFESEQAGTGAHGDINAHIIDLARFITGDEIETVDGAVLDTFVTHRDLVGEAGATSVRSTVDDVSIVIAHMRSGAVATFEASRVATGYMTSNRIEIHGTLGAIRFDFEHMNRLEYFDATQPGHVQGWAAIHVTRGQHGHPYADHWWPEGHGLGYEHTFIHEAADVLADLAGQDPLAPLPDFADALQTEKVLFAATLAFRERTPVVVDDVHP